MLKQNLLVIDDDRVFNTLLCQQLNGMGFEATGVGSWADGKARLAEMEPACIILDYKLADCEAPQVLGELKGQYPVIVLTGFGSIRNAVEIIRQGASDYLIKPVNLDELELTVHRVLENAELRRFNQFYRSQLASRRNALIGDSQAMRELRKLVDMVAPTDTTVLILGESGTGKEVVAHAIHEHSSRADKELMAIDGSGLQETLFESELFGHERGAFTGADRLKKGLVEEAGGSTLFLDEIGDIGPSIQAKLLRLMETASFRRVGGTKTLNADVRFITATNRDLAAMSRDGSFRADLYFRLSRFVIQVPPLRDRREDIETLAHHFLSGAGGIPLKQLSREALALLQGHDWPGNVRELRNAIERACILARNSSSLAAEHLAFLPKNDGDTVLRFSGEPTLERIERDYFRRIMAKYGGNRLKTALALGVSERQVYRLIDKYGLD